MTKTQDFINKNSGKYLEVIDQSNKNQCFDLAVGWMDYIGIPRLASGGSVFPHLYAYQIFTVWSGEKTKYFDKIPNGDRDQPQAGDLVVFGNTYGSAGHVAIATGQGTANGLSTDYFIAFSQNDPIGSKCVEKRYNYNHVIGWLRAKNFKNEESTQVVDLKYKMNFEKIAQYDGFYDVVDEQANRVIEKLKADKNRISEIEKEKTNIENTIKELKGQSINDMSSISKLNQDLKNEKEKIQEIEKTIKAKENEIKALNDQVFYLQQEIQNLSEIKEPKTHVGRILYKLTLWVEGI